MANLVVIRELCKERSMTLRELSRRVGRDESSIQSAIRRGTTNTKTLELIAEELKVSPAIFFDSSHVGSDHELLKEINHLKAVLKEKERLIEVLMSRNNR